MTHFFNKRDPWGHSMGFWVILVMIFITPLAWWSVKRVDLENDVESWLPEHDRQAKTLRWYERHFSEGDHVLVSWDGSSLSDSRLAKFQKELIGTKDAQGIYRDGLKEVEEAIIPEDIIERMVAHDVSREDAIKRLQGILIGAGPLKVELSARGKERRKYVIRELTERVQSELGLELTVVEQQSLADIELEWSEGDEELSDEELALHYGEQGHDFEVRWPGMHAGAKTAAPQVEEILTSLRDTPSKQFPDGEPLVVETAYKVGSPTAMTITLSEAGMADRKGTFVKVRAAAEAAGIPVEILHMGGQAVAGSALNLEVKKAAWNRTATASQPYKRSVILFSCFVSILLAYTLLRSIRLASLVLIVTAYTVFVTVSLVPATHGSMNMVLVVMPTLLSVLTISAAIHVVNYWKYAARTNLKTAIVESARMAAQPCALAALTTAIGLLSLAASPLAPVREFGLYSALGLVISLAVVLLGLPSLLQFWPAKATREIQHDDTFWKGLSSVLTRHRWIVTASCLGFGVYCLCGLTQFRTETKVIRYFPTDSPVVQDYNFLEDNLAGIVPVETVIRFDKHAQEETNFLERLELVRDIQNKLRDHAEISGTISLADFQPHRPAPPESARLTTKIAYNKRAHKTEQQVKKDETAASAFFTVASDSADLEAAGDQGLNKPGDELWRITAQVAILSDMNYEHLTSDIDAIAQGVLKYHAGAGHIVTGMVPVFLRTQQAVLESLIVSFGIAFCIIAVVMMVLLKHPVSGLITMIPNVLPVGVVFGLISWNHVSVDIGTMITASVALGIAVDGTLHLLTWFRNGIHEGLSRQEAISKALAHCGPAMWQTSAVVGIGLLMLYPADLLLISRFGWLMASLIASALVADLIFLPALLAGPLGALIERTAKATAVHSVGDELPQPQTAPALSRQLTGHHLQVASPTNPEQMVSVD